MGCRGAERSRGISAAAVARILTLAVALSPGCGLTVTNDLPTYDELNQTEKDAVDIIYSELSALDTEVRKDTLALFKKTTSLDPIVDRSRINVAYRGMLFSFNFGDGVVYIPAWENLTEAEQLLVGTWFATTTTADTRTTYAKFFYRFMALAQGVKQYMYNVYSVDDVYNHKYLFSMEFDSTRTAHAYLAGAGRKADMWPFVAKACAPLLKNAALQASYASFFTAAESSASPLRFPTAKMYMQDHWKELADPEAPTGYMYFLCQAVTLGQAEASSFAKELRTLHDDLDF